MLTSEFPKKERTFSLFAQHPPYNHPLAKTLVGLCDRIMLQRQQVYAQAGVMEALYRQNNGVQFRPQELADQTFAFMSQFPLSTPIDLQKRLVESGAISEKRSTTKKLSQVKTLTHAVELAFVIDLLARRDRDPISQARNHWSKVYRDALEARNNCPQIIESKTRKLRELVGAESNFRVSPVQLSRLRGEFSVQLESAKARLAQLVSTREID